MRVATDKLPLALRAAEWVKPSTRGYAYAAAALPLGWTSAV